MKNEFCVKLKTVSFITILAISIFGNNALQASQPQTNEKIVSLAPYITEDIYLLEAENKLIGRTTYCVYPPGAKKKTRVATAVEANVEKVLSLNPGLVLASDLINKQDIRKMKDLGLKVVVFSYASSFQELCNQFLKIGRLVKKKKKAKQIIQKVRKRLKKIQNQIPEKNKPTVFLQIGSQPLKTAPRGSFLNDFIKFSGGNNIVNSSRKGNYSREQVLKNNPDYIFITSMGITGEKEKKTWEKFKTLKAVKKNNIHIVDSRRICSPTPITFVEIVKEMANILHSKK